MGRAAALVFPSLCYEGLPGVIIESFCRGTPVIACRRGSMEQMIRDGETGWLVEPGDPLSLSAHIPAAFQADGRRPAMRAAARAEFEDKYSPERNYGLLMSIYEKAAVLAARN